VSAIAFAAAVGLLAGCGTTSDEESRNWAPERLYSEAKEEQSAGNYDRAIKLFDRLEGRAAGTVLAQQAQLERAYVQWKNADKAAALSGLERFIRLHPTSPAIDYAWYLQGLINFNDNLGMFGSLLSQDLAERDQQAARDAYQSFRNLVEQHPQSTYADDARLRMNYIVNSLATYEVHVARYYFRRGAYVAAANRAQQTVQEFQQSPATEEALAIMAMSYDRLGLVQLRDDTERVLRQNYPGSTVQKNGLGGAERPWWRLW
jgi:outer membrane protein assembly factor BamD